MLENFCMASNTIRTYVERLGGCYTCRFFGDRRHPAVWCTKRGGEHVRSQADRGCAFWQREPGADDWLPIGPKDQVSAL